jgi:glycogen(starch) synthase
VKLLVYSHFFAPSIGGVETIVLSLARGFAELRTRNDVPEFDLTVVTETPAGGFDDSSLPFRVIRQPAFLHLWRLVRTSDIIHIAGPALLPLFLGRMARKPVVVEHHGFQTICPNGQLLIEPAGTPCPGHFMAGRHAECLRCNSAQGWFASRKLWLLTFVRRFLCARVSANITPTEWLGAQLHLPRITPVPHGLDTSAAISPAVSSVTPPSATPVIAFQGRLVTTKGVRLLFEAACILHKQSRPFELLVIGDGPERASLEQLAHDSQFSSQVRFAGCLAASELEDALAGVSLVVVPSLGGEVFGLVVAENMLRGLPVIASDLGAFAEVLGPAGLIFRTGDAADLAAKLVQLLDDPVLPTALGHRGQERVFDSYVRGRMIEAHARTYREVCVAAKG